MIACILGSWIQGRYVLFQTGYTTIHSSNISNFPPVFPSNYIWLLPASLLCLLYSPSPSIVNSIYLMDLSYPQGLLSHESHIQAQCLNGANSVNVTSTGSILFSGYSSIQDPFILCTVFPDQRPCPRHGFLLPDPELCLLDDSWRQTAWSPSSFCNHQFRLPQPHMHFI